MNVFESIYLNNSWGFGSGHGSLPSVTKGYRRFLQDFMKDNNIKSVVDFGCGDWQFSKYINWSGVEYIGLETVPNLVTRNNELYGNNNVRFMLSPDKYYKIPKTDLLIVKDVLQHLEEEEKKKFLKELLPKYRFSLIINNTVPIDALNKDIERGSFRPLDLRLTPFNTKATAIYAFGRHRKTFSFKERKFFDPWREIVLLMSSSSP